MTDRIHIPGGKTPGIDGFYEPFRWEQRLYTLILSSDDRAVNTQIRALSEHMGGQIWRAQTVFQLLQTIDNCFEHKHGGV